MSSNLVSNITDDNSMIILIMKFIDNVMRTKMSLGYACNK